MSVEINRTEVVLNNRGARGVNGTVTVSSASGQAVSSRLGMAAISSPVAGQVAILTESGREGTFVFDSSNLNTAVAADTAQAIYVPPSTDTSGASGAWVRKFSGPVNAKWFGATGDGTTNDATALQRWLDYGGALYLPPAKYVSASSLIVRKNVHLVGAAYGFDSRIVNLQDMPGSRIYFSNGTRGLDIQPQWTGTDWSSLTASQEGAAHSVIENIGLIGNGGSGATAVYARTVVHLRNIRAYKFSGKGFDISASVGTSSVSESGNASLSTVEHCQAILNGSHGFHIHGTDANVIKVDTCWAQLNGGWGFLDEAEFANHYANCQAATNSTGAYKMTGVIATHNYINCYVEGGTGENVDISAPAVVNGGILSAQAAQSAKNAHSIGPLPNIQSGEGYSTVRALHIDWNDFSSGPAAILTTDKGVIAGSSLLGLAIQGQGGSAGAIGLYNDLSQFVAYIPIGTRDWTIVGNLTRDGVGMLIGPRAPAISDVAASVAAPTQTEFNNLVTAFNTLKNALSAGAGTNHGLIG